MDRGRHIASPIRIPHAYWLHGAAFVDSQGRNWDSDKYFVGGHSSVLSHPIKGVSDANLLQTQRSGEFRYDIPLAKGRTSCACILQRPSSDLGTRAAAVKPPVCSIFPSMAGRR